MARSASHKFQHASLSAQSSLKASALLKIADTVAGEVTAVVFSGKREPWVHLGERSATRHEYWVGRQRDNKPNQTRLRFVAEVEQSSGGQTSLSTGIAFFRTNQQMFLGFIPGGPKQLADYGYYKRFMVNLEDAITAEDPQAMVQITERA